MSWVEPLLLLFIVLALVGWKRNLPVLLVLALAAAFVTKQHMLLLAPLAVLAFGWRKTAAAGGVAAVIGLPWFLASPTAFYGDSPSLVRDRSVEGYLRTAQTPAGKPAVRADGPTLFRWYRRGTRG